QFMLDQKLENTGYLYDAERYLIAAYQFETVFINLSDSIKGLIELLSDSLICILEEKCAGNSDAIVNQINLLNQTLANIEIIREASIEDDLANAELSNHYVVNGKLPELNTAFINEIEILYAENQNRDRIFENYEDILSIASQCPYTGGPAVERARTFIAIVNDSIAYDDETVCLIHGVFRASNVKFQQFQEESKIMVKPNPANSKVEITLKGGFEDGICKIELRNFFGQLLIT